MHSEWWNQRFGYKSFFEHKHISNVMILFNPSRPNTGRREKNNLNFYFHSFLWCRKRFYECLKPFEALQRIVKNKNLS